MRFLAAITVTTYHKPVLLLLLLLIFFKAHQHKAAGRKTRLDIQNYGCNGNLLCYHGVVERNRISSLQRHGKALEKECCLPGVFCDSGDTPANLLCELNGHLMPCTSCFYGKWVKDYYFCSVLMQEPNQRDGAAAAGERGVAETAEQVVVRQGPVRRRVRQQGLYRNISVDFERKFREPCFDWIQKKIKQDQNAGNSPITA